MFAQHFCLRVLPHYYYYYYYYYYVAVSWRSFAPTTIGRILTFLSNRCGWIGRIRSTAKPFRAWEVFRCLIIAFIYRRHFILFVKCNTLLSPLPSSLATSSLLLLPKFESLCIFTSSLSRAAPPTPFPVVISQKNIGVLLFFGSPV
jgi:hypothetical protein